MTYTISDEAARHLADLWDYIKEQNDADTADRFIDDLFVTFDTLAQFPDMGRPRAYLPTQLLAFPHAKYMIFYRKMGEGVEISHVLHGGRDFFSYFAEP